MAAENLRLRIEPVDEAGDWSDLPAAAILADIAVAVSGREPNARGTVAVALADDRLTHDLNRRFRAVDRPTNVLAFPSGESPGRDVHLGDVVLSVDALRREAAAEEKPLSHHFAHLAVHGLLHVLGYDHETDADAATMEAVETAILAELGIADPYGHEPAHRVTYDRSDHAERPFSDCRRPTK